MLMHLLFLLRTTLTTLSSILVPEASRTCCSLLLNDTLQLRAQTKQIRNRGAWKRNKGIAGVFFTQNSAFLQWIIIEIPVIIYLPPAVRWKTLIRTTRSKRKATLPAAVIHIWKYVEVHNELKESCSILKVIWQSADRGKYVFHGWLAMAPCHL